MRKHFVILAVVLLGIFVGSAASGAVSADVKKLPPLLKFQIGQVGDGEIFVLFYGTNLPTPELRHFENEDDLEIVFKNVQNKIRPDDIGLTEFPLITDISFRQEGLDAVIHIQTEGKMLLKERRGTGPANRISLILVSESRQERIQNEKTVLDRRLPPVPLISALSGSASVTLELRDIPLADVARMLGGVVKKNIVVDKSLPTDLVTMSLKGVPFNEVISYMKRMYDIDFALLGENTIIVGARDSLSKLSGRETTQSFQIAYADVGKMADLLSSVMDLTADERKKIVADDRLRMLYVTASPERLEEIAVALQRLDAPGRQVMLHARVFEFGDDDSLLVETMINAIYDNWWLTFSAEEGGKIGLIDGKGPRLDFPTPRTPINDIIKGTTRMVDGMLSATAAKTKVKVLASPSVITIDGQSANVDMTQDYPYTISEGTGTDRKVTSQNATAGPKMTMTPKIGRDSVITIVLDLNADDIIGYTREDKPITSKRHVGTTVRVRNGEPFVVGGLHREYTSKTKSKIPILGDIPLIGFLFSKINNSTVATQAVMLVVPYILDTPDSAVEGAHMPFRR